VLKRVNLCRFIFLTLTLSHLSQTTTYKMPRTKNTENNQESDDKKNLCLTSWMFLTAGSNQNDNVSLSLYLSPQVCLHFEMKHCYMCLQGGQLTLCDYCPHCVCMKCVTIPPNASFGLKVTFLCLLCYEKTFRGLKPYFVQLFILSEANSSSHQLAGLLLFQLGSH
jgi:hypothetical protein